MSQYENSSTNNVQGSMESLATLDATPQGKYGRWKDEINAAEKESVNFIDIARRVIRRYLDERDAIDTGKKWFNIFYTNVGIMEASLYANIPDVDVSRKFNDMNDDVARVAALLLQRNIQQDMSEPECDFDQVMRQAVQDRLIPGLGTAWLRLETETEDQPLLEDGTQLKDEEDNPLQQIAYQCVCVDYVFWEDFLWSPCRVWAERRWVARRVAMTRDALVKRFGEEKGKRIPLDYAPSKSVVTNANTSKNMVLKRAAIYEIWDRETRTVLWLSKGMDELLDEKPDPLKLAEHFEPCPKPLFANLTTSNCLPKPDYAMIQDQYNELDEVNNRISKLIQACKVVGVYDRSAEGIQRMLTEGSDNTLIPVDNWAMFADKGGVKGQIDWLPLEVVVAALAQLQAHREAVKYQIYELTGINDIVRGNTKASETLGAQELKSKFASVRIQKLQDEVTRFAEEILSIKGEIIVKHFDPQIIAKMANAESLPMEDQQYIVPALKLLKGNEEEMEWRIEIQSDAMAIIDWNRQKTERTEFLTAVATFLQSASTVGQGRPELIPLMLNMLQFGVAGFRVGKDMEGVFDKYIADFEQQIEAQKNAPPPPDPEMEKIKAETAARQQELAMEQQAKQQDAMLELRKAQQEAVLEQQKAAQEAQQRQQEFIQQMQQSQQQFAQEMRQMMQEFALTMQMKREQNAADVEAKKAIAAATPKPNGASHD